MKKIKLTTIIFAICCVSFLAFLAFNPSHAYFQSHAQATGVNTAKVDLLFDKFNEGTLTADGTPVDLNADWGTPTNPYVMTGKNHVNNLFILQRSGYFANKVDSNTKKARQSYFVVATKDGEPIGIDCAGMTINPIGTAKNPFTGNIQGALKDGQDEYGNLTVTQSTIANLTVLTTATESVLNPDIGFFGRLSYVGKEQSQADGTVTLVADDDGNGPFAASVNNLLFADITIKNDKTFTGEVADWWNQISYDEPHDTRNETHHVGIVVGHAEFTTLTDISVYYSSSTGSTPSNVAAFELAGDTTGTANNYYSITGIIGTARFVNPSISSEGVINSAGSISDEDLTEELLSGGGGEGSGMLTGYMLAENIFNRKDASNQMTTLDYYAEAYDVRNITEGDTPIFSKVTMRERQNAAASWRNVDYYYFADTVFTFAMTATGDATSTENLDYVIKIWDLTDEKQAPPLYLTPQTSDWAHDLTGNEAYLYKLQLVTDQNQLKKDSYYVLAYRTTENGQEVLHALDVNNPTGGFVNTIIPYTEDADSENDFTNNTIFFVNSSNASYLPLSFVYNSKLEASSNDNHKNSTDVYHTIISADKETVLGLYSDKPSSGYYFQVPYLASAGTTDTKTDLFSSMTNGAIDQDSAKWFSWKLTVENSKVTVSGDFYHRHAVNGGGWLGWYSATNYVTTYSSVLVYDKTSKSFDVRSNVVNNGNEETGNPAFTLSGETALNVNHLTSNGITFPISSPALDAEDETAELLLYHVVPTDSDTPYTKDISEKNMIAPNDAIVFDSSKDILFCEPVVRNTNEDNTSFNARVNANNSYELIPLINKKWNSGKGHYLKQLNHVVQMAKPTTFSHKFTFANSDSIFSELFGDAMDFNTGGILTAPLGTTGLSYTMPMGTIVFYINEASQEDPSYINIIVAVPPDGKKTTVGLWGPQKTDETSATFVSNAPDQAFTLPISVVANQSENARFTHIKSYYEEKSDTPITGEDGNGFYTHLGGEVAFVGCTFEVTSTGVYILAPSSDSTGRMSVAYFSVDGAAGAGGDGTGGSPLGNVDFVYSSSASIITVDKLYSGAHAVDGETPETFYYPSYFYIRMLPEKDKSTIPYESVYVRRYVLSSLPNVDGVESDRRRVMQMTAADPDTKLLTLSEIFGDLNYDDIDP